jgi:hypothetical protein
MTAEAYEACLHENLSDLLERFKSGRYRAPPVRRVRAHSQGRDEQDPAHRRIPTLEDKILQRAVLMALEPVYEQDFLDCSYGFRPGRSAHQALEALWKGLMDIGGGWVIDLDIQGLFDSMERTHLNAFLDQRVRDGVIRRVLGKWMQAGVMEERPDWWTFAAPHGPARSRAHSGSEASTCSASPTIGGVPGRGAGWCNARRPRPASAAPCGGSGTGAGVTVTSRWRNSNEG